MIEKFRSIFTGLEERFGYHIVENQNSNSTKKSGDLLSVLITKANRNSLEAVPSSAI